jgi:hypothetical protein
MVATAMSSVVAVQSRDDGVALRLRRESRRLKSGGALRHDLKTGIAGRDTNDSGGMRDSRAPAR